MSTTNGTIKVLVLGVLAEMLKKRALSDSFNNYVELLILKVLHVYRDPCKDVSELKVKYSIKYFETKIRTSAKIYC